jgi:hypothetical protein
MLIVLDGIKEIVFISVLVGTLGKEVALVLWAYTSGMTATRSTAPN